MKVIYNQEGKARILVCHYWHKKYKNSSQKVRIVSYFTSSLDEKAPVCRDLKSSHFLDNANKLASYCQDRGIRLIIRHHPNLGQVGNPIASEKVIENINKVGEEYNNVEIIAPNSGIDSGILSISVIHDISYTTLFIDSCKEMALTTVLAFYICRKRVNTER